MQSPPLRLERSFLTQVEIIADPKHRPGEVEIELKAKRTMGILSPDGLLWQLDLDLVVGGKEGAVPPPYRIHLHTIGNFSFAETTHTDSEKASLLVVTGVSILYSQAREFILMVTGRGPWGAYQLPTVSFFDDELAGKEKPAGVVREPNSKYHASPQTKKKSSPRKQSILQHKPKSR